MKIIVSFFYKIKKAVDTHKIKTSSTVYVVKVTSFDMRNVPTPFLELPGEKMPKTLVAYHNYWRHTKESFEIEKKSIIRA